MENVITDNRVNYMRQTLLFDPHDHLNARVVIVGLGNIGSNAAVTLARLGITSFVLYDFDDVENHNLTSQHYGINDLGKSKVGALAEQLFNINQEAHFIVRKERFTGNKESLSPNDILIIAIDTMEGRREIHKVMSGASVLPRLIIDARVGGGQLEVYSFTSLEEWGKSFPTNPGQDPCGGRFICYTSVICGALITNQVKKFLRGEKYDKSFMLHVDTLQVMKDYAW